MDDKILFFVLVSIVGIWILCVIISIIGVIKGKASYKRREKHYKEVIATKKEDIQKYVNMLTSNSELEQSRIAYQNSKWCVWVVILIFIAMIIFLHYVNPLILIFGIIISSIIVFSNKEKYTKIYKKQVIASILNNYDKDLKYLPENGIREVVYCIGKFESFDKYWTEDLIAGKICGLDFAIADVHTEEENTDSDGDRHYVTIFRGPVAVVELNKLNDLVLYISDNQLKLFRGNEYVEIDNQAFEDKYDVFTNDEVVAMRILTPALTNKIIEMRDKFGFFFEIKVIGGLLFFRFHSYTLFSPSPDDIEKEAADIAFYFNMLDGMKNIVEEITKVLCEFER